MDVNKSDTKKVIDILKDACIVTQEFTGKITFNVSQGTITVIQLEQSIRPR